MIVRNRKSHQNRAYRLEVLESRQLLSNFGHSAHHVAEVSVAKPATHETIKGLLSGQGELSPITSTRGTASFMSSGTVIGPSTFDGGFSYSATKSHTIKYSGGEGVLANLDGDQIDVSFSGSGRATNATEVSFPVKGSVKGGAGAYAGAKGSFTGKESLNTSTGAFAITVTITLTRV